ncbi:MAG TPA: hypothetical protein VK327_12485 [Candidatus Paceibacterota bacterium]|nr:hypothetical protein [Candidatus Paceibacterota bacterium]
MKKFVFALLLSIPVCGWGMDRLSALSMLETGDNDFAVGRAGEISRFQVLRREWRSVTNSSHYADSETARGVVHQIMERRIQAFQVSFGRLPSDFEYYALWNAPAQALSGKLSRRVAERCQRFANLCTRDRDYAQGPGRKVF